MSQTQPEVNKLMLDIFGDSDDEDEELPTAPPVARVTAPKPTTGRDVDGLFESDEEDNVPPLKIQKTSTERGISKKVVPSGSVKKRTPSGTSDGASKKQRTPLDGDSSDEYDSDGDVEKTAEDEAFIDAEDDNADLLNEYDEERQNFRDERPTHKTGKAARDSGDRATKADDPVSQVLADLQGGRKSAKMTEEQKQTLAQELLFRMDRAAKEDDQLYDSRQPAMCKINILETVQRMCNVKELQHTLLEFDLLGVLRVWIEPRDAKTLPSLTIRRAVYDMLLRIPCQPDHLKRSGIGKTVVTLRKHKAELPENKAVLKAVMEKWSRPIFSKPGAGGYEDGLKEYELRVAAQQRRAAEVDGAARANLEDALTSRDSKGDGYSRARTPVSTGFIFTVRPDVQPVGERAKPTLREGGSKGELVKKMKELQSQGMRIKLNSR